MATTLQLMDADETTVLFDFNAAAGTGNPASVRTDLLGDVDLGRVDQDVGLFEPESEAGAIVTRRRDPAVQMSFRFRLRAPSTGPDVDDLIGAINDLDRWLRNPPGPLRWQPDGAAAARFIDLLAAQPLPGLFRGQEFGLYTITRLLDDVDGVTVVLLRQPYLRATAKTTLLSAVTVQNDPADPNGKAVNVTNNGDAPMAAEIKVVGNTGSKIQEVLVAVYDGPNPTAYRSNRKFVQCEANSPTGWTVTRENNTGTVNDAGASPGSGTSAAQTTFGTDDTVLRRRVRATRTSGVAADMVGDWEVYVRIGSSSATSTYGIQLRWAPSTADPVPFVEDEVVVTPVSVAPSWRYFLLRLGRISIPKTATGLALELWARWHNTEASALRWDYVFLVPANAALSRVVVPETAPTRFLGKDLVTPVGNPTGGTAGVVDGDDMVFDNETDNAGSAPNTGSTLPAGRHTVKFRRANTQKTHTVGRVRNITDSANVVSLAALTELEWRVLFDIVSGEANAPTDNYQFQLVAGSGVTAQRMKSIEHRFIPVVGASEAIQTRPLERRVEKLDASGNLTFDLGTRGAVPVLLPPGTSTLVLSFDDVAPITSTEVSDLLEDILTRDCTVTVTGYERFLA